MQFHSLAFLVFLGVCLLLHRLPLSWRTRKRNLLGLSYLFYAAWNPPFVVLLWISTVADWFLGARLHRTEGVNRRRALLLASLAVNLGMLSYFKYGAFLAENFAALASFCGWDWRPAVPSIALPIGISFYTFQTLSYTLDIYHRRMEPSKSFLDYALFVTFFPQLVAGPIVRARQFLPQLVRPTAVEARHLAWGACLIVLGLFEKVVVADGLLAPEVERVFDHVVAPTSIDAWIACFGFAGQLYCDFSGYSLCAIGAAYCLGFQLPINFRFPLAAVGFRDGWNRWHISLTTWLRDYVYRTLHSLGGRRSPWLWGFNVLLTWILIGLWHGAAWRFVLWGLTAGALLILEFLVRSALPPMRLWRRRAVRFVLAASQFTLAVACMAPFFRSQNTERMTLMLRALVGAAPESAAALLSPPGALVLLGTAWTLFLVNWVMRDSSLERLAARTPWPVLSLALGLMLGAIVVSHGSDRAFVYFQF